MNQNLLPRLFMMLFTSFATVTLWFFATASATKTTHSSVTPFRNRTLSDIQCMADRHWYAFLCSSLITFFVGLLLVLTWRICAWVFCKNAPGRPKLRSRGEGGGSLGGGGPVPPSVVKVYGDRRGIRASETDIGWMTEAKDWAGELISGQTTTGRILVSSTILFNKIGRVQSSIE